MPSVYHKGSFCKFCKFPIEQCLCPGVGDGADQVEDVIIHYILHYFVYNGIRPKLLMTDELKASSLAKFQQQTNCCHLHLEIFKIVVVGLTLL